MAGRTLGVILAGGRAARFAGGDKARALLKGRPLIAWVAARLLPQVDGLAINAPDDAAPFPGLAAPVFADARGGHQGPLAGIVAAAAYAAANGFDDVATVPCDAPGIGDDLVARLRAARDRACADCAVAQVAGRINPVFALYRVHVHEALRVAFDAGLRAPRDLATILHVAPALFAAAEAAAFRDIDTRQDLALLEAEG